MGVDVGVSIGSVTIIEGSMGTGVCVYVGVKVAVSGTGVLVAIGSGTGVEVLGGTTVGV